MLDVLARCSGNGGPLAVSTRPLHFAPGRRHSLQILQSTRVDCPLGVSWPGPSLRITKFPPSQLRRHTRPFITLPCRWKGVGVGRGERKATQTINRSREKGRGFVARQLSCSSTSTSRVGEGCGLQRNHESPDGSREAMRRRWTHGWKRRQTRVMQLSMGVLGFGPAEIEREREKSSHDFALARTEQPAMSPARRVNQLATASGDRVLPVSALSHRIWTWKSVHFISSSTLNWQPSNKIVVEKNQLK